MASIAARRIAAGDVGRQRDWSGAWVGRRSGTLPRGLKFQICRIFRMHRGIDAW